MLNGQRAGERARKCVPWDKRTDVHAPGPLISRQLDRLKTIIMKCTGERLLFYNFVAARKNEKFPYPAAIF